MALDRAWRPADGDAIENYPQGWRSFDEEVLRMLDMTVRVEVSVNTCRLCRRPFQVTRAMVKEMRDATDCHGTTDEEVANIVEFCIPCAMGEEA